MSVTPSNAQKIKVLYKELLSDGEEHSRIELFSYAQKNGDTKFTEGMLTGALRTLISDTDEYACVNRGCYKKKSILVTNSDSNSLVDSYTELLRNVLRKKKEITGDPFEIINMSDSDKNKLKTLEKCFDFISNTINNLS